MQHGAFHTLQHTVCPMKFHLSTSEGNTITAHGNGYVRIGTVDYHESIVVMPAELITGWAPEGFGALNESDFEQIARLEPEIVLLGTGERLQFPHPRLSRVLVDAHVGMEVMGTAAACRTYNILAAEGRKVAAALIIEARA